MPLIDRFARHPRRALALVMVLFVLYGTLVPFDLRADAETLARQWRGAHLKPFRGSSRTDLVGNLMLFGLLGFCVQAWFDPHRRRALRGIVATTLVGAVLSLLIEAVQLFSPSRVTSVTDWMVDTIGSCAGALAGLIYARTVADPLATWAGGHASRNPRLLAAVALAVFLAIGGLAPFTVSIDVSDVAGQARRFLHFDLFQPERGVGAAAHWAREAARAWQWVALAFLAGLAAAADRGERPSPLRAFWHGLLATVGLATLIEMGQIAIIERVPDASDIIVATVGGLIGALAAIGYGASDPADPDRRRRRAGRAALLALVVTIAVFWIDVAYPYRFDLARAAERLRVEHLIPMYAYFEKTTLQAIEDLVEAIGSGMPIGLLVAVLLVDHERLPEGTGLGALVTGAAASGIVATVGEALQLAVAGRVADVTDVLAAIPGGAVGAGCWLWYVRTATTRSASPSRSTAPPRPPGTAGRR